LRFHTNSDEDLQGILEAIGVHSVDALFDSIPDRLRLSREPDLPGPLSEVELDRELGRLAARNRHARQWPSFLGAGAYSHYAPSVIDHLILRGEFLTAYTPYQAEMSQGTLQAIYEFQTMVCQLTEMEVANASLYDGATATAEAVFMAHRVNRRTRVLVSRAVHPNYREVVRSLTGNLGLEVVEVPFGEDGRTDRKALAAELTDAVAAVVVQSPNFFGCVEDLDPLLAAARERGALGVVAVAEAISLGLLAGPGRFGADIVVGEGQSFGLPMAFGGPYLGLMATRERFVRQMPGRLVGEAFDAEGERGYVLTLSTREQHIRRERATSNICTNQGLCALTATIYLSLVGRVGLRRIARRNLDAAAHLRERLLALPGLSVRFPAPTFNEFVVDLPEDAEACRARMREQGLIGGLPLGTYYPELDRSMLLCATELTRREDVDALVRCLQEVG
jgi:glycine dehydrogenase subunit 1